MKEEVLASAIIPNDNHARYLDVHSVLVQTQ